MRLATHDLTAAIGTRDVVTGVNLDVPSGTTLALVGVNGSGKSTLLRTIAGVRPAPHGHVTLDGQRTDHMGPRERARLVALVAQDEPPPEDLLVGEMVALGLTPHRRSWSGGGRGERAAVLAVLDRVDLADHVDHVDHVDRPCTRMSGGKQRRALLARGLVQDTPILLLDEPTNHLDVAQQHRLLQLVRGLDRTIVMAIHDLDLAQLYAYRVAVLHHGRVLAMGTPDEVFARDDVGRAFGVRIARVTDPAVGATRLMCVPWDSHHPRPTTPLPEQR